MPLPPRASVQSRCSRGQLFATLWTVALQAPLSTAFSRQEYWSGLPCLPPGTLPDPGIEPVFLVSPELAGATWEVPQRFPAHLRASVSPLPHLPLDPFGITASSTDHSLSSSLLYSLFQTHLHLPYIVIVCLLAFATMQVTQGERTGLLFFAATSAGTRVRYLEDAQ